MTYEGEWKEGSYISFFDTSGQGTKIVVEEVNPNESIKSKHVAMVEAGNKEVAEVAELLKIHPNTLRYWDEKGIFKAVKLDERKIRRYRKSDVEAFIQEGLART